MFRRVMALVIVLALFAAALAWFGYLDDIWGALQTGWFGLVQFIRELAEELRR